MISQVNSFRFELVDNRVLTEHIGWLDSVTGGSITESWRGDWRVTGSLDVDAGADIPLSAAIRIWHDWDDGDGLRTEVMATLFPEPAELVLLQGRQSGSIELHSAMRRLDTDLTKTDVGVPTGAAVAYRFQQLVRNSGGTPWVWPSTKIHSARTSANRVWEHGKSVLSECHAMADACGGRVEVDEQGRVCLVPYQLPASIAESWRLMPGEVDCTLLPEFVTNAQTIVNRVIASYERDDKRWYAEAKVAVTHPWAFQRIGRWETVEASAPTIEEGQNVQAVLDKLVRQRLSELSDVRRTYSAEMLYRPDVRVGTVGSVMYSDSEDGVAVGPVTCFVSEREVTLDAAMRTRLTLEEV